MPQDRAAYDASVGTFRMADPQAILGQLARSQSGDLTPAQRDAWLQQIHVLKRALEAVPDGTLLFEFLIPRMGKRADNVLLIGGLVLVLEFKVGADGYDRAAVNQVTDYALDLKNFHAGSHEVLILPVLVATRAPAVTLQLGNPIDGIFPVGFANADTLGEVIRSAISAGAGAALDHATWLAAGYRPTPTIVEASQILYRGHSVADITRSEAGADNLGRTTAALQAIIDDARATGAKAICLVTGVPGAGKTLAGLNLVSLRRNRDDTPEEHAVFLSGNGPLVKVLEEALARDEVAQAKARGAALTKADALRHAHAFIQNVHHFRDECLKDAHPPVERVIVFDEAQRAWDRDQTSKFMQQKRGHRDFDQSEPAFMVSVMDRHPTWAVVVCLIGGGQEINTGEAGLEEWLRVLRDRFPSWRVYLPAEAALAEFLPTFRLSELGERLTHEPSLHLGVSLRSFRAERLSSGIAALMSGQAEVAREQLSSILVRFPIVVTRSLHAARRWLRGKARGTERIGLLASSGGKRLKPLGISMDVQIDPCMWFLNDAADVRSSHYLEDAASEFDVQGLELDWTAVIWDGDLSHQDGGWHTRAFKGTRWQEIHGEAARRYRQNCYRVLLTRARQGMVIVVPEGDALDPTREAGFYDPTWDYLRLVGLPALVEGDL